MVIFSVFFQSKGNYSVLKWYSLACRMWLSFPSENWFGNECKFKPKYHKIYSLATRPKGWLLYGNRALWHAEYPAVTVGRRLLSRTRTAEYTAPRSMWAASRAGSQSETVSGVYPRVLNRKRQHWTIELGLIINNRPRYRKRVISWQLSPESRN
jgi:hypothetical protein